MPKINKSIKGQAVTKKDEGAPVRDQIVERVVREEAAKVASESLAADNAAKTVRDEMVKRVVLEEAGKVASDAIVTDSVHRALRDALVDRVVKEESEKIACEVMNVAPPVVMVMGGTIGKVVGPVAPPGARTGLSSVASPSTNRSRAGDASARSGRAGSSRVEALITGSVVVVSISNVGLHVPDYPCWGSNPGLAGQSSLLHLLNPLAHLSNVRLPRREGRGLGWADSNSWQVHTHRAPQARQSGAYRAHRRAWWREARRCGMHGPLPRRRRCTRS